MKSIELMATGIRVLGLVVIIFALESIFYYYQQYQLVFNVWSQGTDGFWPFVALAVVHVVLFLAIAFVMLRFPVLVSRWLLPKAQGEQAVFDGSAKDIEVVAFVIIGVYILSWAIPDFIHNGLWWWHSAQKDLNGPGAPEQKYEHMINQAVTVVEFAIGLYLCLRAKGLSVLLRRLREAGNT